MKRCFSLNRIIDEIENSFIIVLLRNSFSSASPFLIIGAFALMLYSFPINSWQGFLSSESGAFIKNVLYSVNNFTLNILSLVLVITLSFNYSKLKDPKRSVLYLVVAVASYCAFVCINDETLGFDVFTPKWTLTAIIVTMLSCFLFNRFSKLLNNNRSYALCRLK